MLALQCATQLSDSTRVRFAAVMHDLGKARTPQEKWPSHHGHEELGVSLIQALAARLKVPNDYRDLAVLVARYHGNIHRAKELRATTVLKVIEETDAFRRPERFAEMLTACEADARGRTGLEKNPYLQREFFMRALQAASAVVLTEEDRVGLAGPAIGEKIRRKRLAAVEAVCEQRNEIFAASA
jgi:tRNA nucleotidyltransferase (CCA-adding enzyme)